MANGVIRESPISKETLETLIASAIPEGQTLDYKRAINVETAKAKLEFCADVAAFANASGGEIIFGIEEDGDGKAKALKPLVDFLQDRTERQLRQILNSHVDPAIPGLLFEVVELSAGDLVLVLRIPRSWSRPHSILGDIPAFPIREGAQKRFLKVRELREAFVLAESVSERMRRFRSSRIAVLVSGEGPATLATKSLIVLHVMPLQAFDQPTLLDIRSAIRKHALLWPINTQGLTMKINFDGLLTYSPGIGGPVQSYVQLFRDGCIEAVNADILSRGGDQKFLYSGYEPRIAAALGKYMSFLQSEGIQPPIFVALSLVNAKGYSIPVPDQFGEMDAGNTSINDDVLLVPETRIDSYAENYYAPLQEPFDRIWQACGRVGSLNYKEGVWIRKEGT
jgi:Putative DNA-binding domain